MRTIFRFRFLGTAAGDAGGRASKGLLNMKYRNEIVLAQQKLVECGSPATSSNILQILEAYNPECQTFLTNKAVGKTLRSMGFVVRRTKKNRVWVKPKQTEGDGPFYTYFVQGHPLTPVKIGRAKDVDRRLSELQTANYQKLRLLLVLKGDLESDLHDLFSKHRIDGEWFRWCDEIKEFIYSQNQGRNGCWHLVNVYCTSKEREMFNDWHAKAYLALDKLTDWIRHTSLKFDVDIPEDLEVLQDYLCQVPWLED